MPDANPANYEPQKRDEGVKQVKTQTFDPKLLLFVPIANF
jgi:hypothetical protein